MQGVRLLNSYVHSEHQGNLYYRFETEARDKSQKNSLFAVDVVKSLDRRCCRLKLQEHLWRQRAKIQPHQSGKRWCMAHKCPHLDKGISGISDIPLLNICKHLEQTVYRLTNDQERYEFVVQLTKRYWNAMGSRITPPTVWQGWLRQLIMHKLCKNDPAISIILHGYSFWREIYQKLKRVTSKGLTDLTRGRMEEPLDWLHILKKYGTANSKIE